jgi:L-amino acid N-acyltransferase YncA
VAVSIRAMRATDVAQACELLNAIIRIGGTTAAEAELSETEFTQHYVTADNKICCHVAVDEAGQIAGFQWLGTESHLEAKCADIATFARTVSPVRGTGRALFETTTAFARTLGYDQINAKIRADNVPGLGYYSKMGFIDYSIAQAVPLRDGTPVDRISKRYNLT